MGWAVCGCRIRCKDCRRAFVTWKWDVLGVSRERGCPQRLRDPASMALRTGRSAAAVPSMFAGRALKRSVTTASVPGAEEPSFPHGRARRPSAMVKRAKEDSRRFYYIHTRNFLFHRASATLYARRRSTLNPLSIPIHSPFELSKRVTK